MSRKIVVKLNPSENALKGTYHPDDDVMVELDATNAAFSVEMPDAYDERVSFYFVKTDSTSNTITLTALAGQKIMEEDTQVICFQADVLRLRPNGDGKFW